MKNIVSSLTAASDAFEGDSCDSVTGVEGDQERSSSNEEVAPMKYGWIGERLSHAIRKRQTRSTRMRRSVRWKVSSLSCGVVRDRGILRMSISVRISAHSNNSGLSIRVPQVAC